MWRRKKKESNDTVRWNFLENKEAFDDLLKSGERFLIFKHSGRCSISLTAKSRMDAHLSSFDSEVYLVDVIGARELSQHIAHVSGVVHESPQLIKFNKGKAVKTASHLSIYPKEFNGN
ncbi:bacillithiol system redox-active protein YtxJ [Luteibaculum oceani]|uniref:Bacillithiol system redox-active protein YtxJ n=1 Tax=Luteibaculum oceani TaxID=1294296 RepID=A0A5C6V3Y3_9FLAO|nr:bacillithiol system redox-active protein YtxJ [Luteibaculum oceani]TXC78378.1 bacillithiol system redox-active protein YtxJ [Luteibaculum oceani]